MNKMEQEVLKKSEFKTLVGLVISTVTIMLSLVFGFVSLKDAIVEDIRSEFRAEIKNQLNEHDAKQALRDKDQDYKIERIEVAIENIKNK